MKVEDPVGQVLATGDARAAIDETVSFLASDEGERAIARDAYWPKWEGPWWRMTLLWELGLADRIPARAAGRVLEAMSTTYIRFFALTPEEVPAGKSPELHVPCHCQLGTIVQVLRACGVDVSAELPWVRTWFFRYQLPDGGLNCDEQAYLKPEPRRSSFESTVVTSEGILHGFAAGRALDAEETAFLERTTAYLLRRQLARSLSKGGAIPCPEWLVPCFPRFYEYDVLRGLRLVARHATRTGARLDPAAVMEAAGAVEAALARDDFGPRRFHEGKKTKRQDASGEWRREPAGTFPLLDIAAGPLGAAVLRREWADTRALLERAGALRAS
jgi:hypothetical protein